MTIVFRAWCGVNVPHVAHWHYTYQGDVWCDGKAVRAS